MGSQAKINASTLDFGLFEWTLGGGVRDPQLNPPRKKSQFLVANCIRRQIDRIGGSAVDGSAKYAKGIENIEGCPEWSCINGDDVLAIIGQVTDLRDIHTPLQGAIAQPCGVCSDDF